MGGHAAGGAFWSIVQAFAAKFAGILAQFAALYVLDKSSLGVVYQAWAITAFTIFFQRFGMTEVLVQRQRRFSEFFVAGFGISIASAVIAVFLSCLVAIILGCQRGNWLLSWLIMVYASSCLIDAFITCSQAKMRIDLRFRDQSMIQLRSSFITAALTIIFLLIGMGPMSIMLPRPLSKVYELIAFYRAEPVPIKINFQWGQWRPLIRDGLPLSLSLLCSSAIYNGDNLSVGMFCGEAALGIYAVGFNLSTQTLQLLVGNITPTFFSVLSKLSAEPARQAEAFLRATEVMALIVIPVCILQAAVAAPLLHMFFRHKWDAAIPVLQVLSLGMSFTAIWMGIPALLQAQGRFKLLLQWQGIVAIIFFVSVMTAAILGNVLWVATVVCAFYTFCTPIGAYIAMRPGNISLRRTVVIYIWPILGSLIACAIPLVVIDLGGLLATKMPMPLVGGTIARLLLKLPEWPLHFAQLCAISVAALSIYAILTAVLRKESARTIGYYLEPLLARLRTTRANSILSRFGSLVTFQRA